MIAIIPEATQLRVDNRERPQTYVVVLGDNLYMIARRLLGDGARHRELFELNADIIPHPALIQTGMVLRLPAV